MLSQLAELVNSASVAFLENEEALLRGKYTKELIADTPYKENIDEAKSIALKNIYWSERKFIPIADSGPENKFRTLLDLSDRPVASDPRTCRDPNILKFTQFRTQMLARLRAQSVLRRNQLGSELALPARTRLYHLAPELGRPYLFPLISIVHRKDLLVSQSDLARCPLPKRVKVQMM